MRRRTYAVVMLAAMAAVPAACTQAGRDDGGPNGSGPNVSVSSGTPGTGPDAAGAAFADDPAAREELTAALSRTHEQDSFALTIAGASMTMAVEADVAGRRMHLTAEGSGEDHLDAEALVIDDDIYIRYLSGGLADDSGGRWIATAAADTGDDPFGIEKLFDATTLLGGPAAVQADGGGVFRVSSGDLRVGLPSLFAEMLESGGAFTPIGLRVTVGDDGLISTVEISAADPAQNAVITVEDYGITVDVEKPADSDIMG